MAVAHSTELRSRRLTGRIGAEISGVDLGCLDDGDVAAIRQELLAHRVVFFRDQTIGAAEQIAFASRLGPLTLGHPTLPQLTEERELFDLDSIAGASANHWHTDVTFVERPPIFSVLRAVIIPEVGGDTLWANTVAGYEDVPDDLRQLADRLVAVHSNGHDYGRVDVARMRGKLRPEQLAHLQAFVSEVYETEHPVVRVHPETGERALLLGQFVRHILGVPSADSKYLFELFQRHITRLENTVRWRWSPGDVAIWDNRATQHYAIFDYGTEHRRGERVTVAGPTPVGVDGRPSVALQGNASAYYTGATEADL